MKNNEELMKELLEKIKSTPDEIIEEAIGILSEKLKGEKKVTKRWRAKEYSNYFAIYGDTIQQHTEYEYDSDNSFYNTGNYFKTEKQAEKQLEKVKIYQRLKDLALELNNGEKIDWNDNNQIKYYIYYDYEDDYIGDDLTTYWKDIGQIYCLNENFKDIGLERIGEDNLRKLLKEE